MKSRNKIGQQGFTLIELVVVIVIIGILAAFAIPRFSNIASDARKSSVSGLVGSVRSTSALAHGLALARNQAGATGSITLEGNAVALVFGYPDAPPTGAPPTGGIINALSTTEGYTITSDGLVTTFTIPGAADAANCKVTYAEPTAANTAPVITSVDTGC